MSDVYTDYSCTIFLNNPDEYDGGDLVIKVGDIEQKMKLGRGKILIYDTGSCHEVKDVISGSRKCLVFWMESSFRNTEVRKLYENLSNIFIKYEDMMETNLFLKRDLFSIQQQILRNYGTRVRKNNK
jgi:PKHD-type hydroxylase